jgi:hypothetical protein
LWTILSIVSRIARFVRVRLPGVASDVLVRGPRTVQANVGERVPIALDVNAAHLFDPAITLRLH